MENFPYELSLNFWMKNHGYDCEYGYGSGNGDGRGYKQLDGYGNGHAKDHWCESIDIVTYGYGNNYPMNKIDGYIRSCEYDNETGCG